MNSVLIVASIRRREVNMSLLYGTDKLKGELGRNEKTELPCNTIRTSASAISIRRRFRDRETMGSCVQDSIFQTLTFRWPIPSSALDTYSAEACSRFLHIWDISGVMNVGRLRDRHGRTKLRKPSQSPCMQLAVWRRKDRNLSVCRTVQPFVTCPNWLTHYDN